MRKIINDPIHGFISVGQPLLVAIIDHPIFQRLRRIRQGGLIEYVYPGAVHTRFHHSMGVMQMMSWALEHLQKNIAISPQEKTAALMAALLHDLGHAPLSHILEKDILPLSHEHISLMLMEKLNTIFEGQLQMAIQIFENKYQRPFFYQLISGQIDVDRMDYIQRDSYYSGVSEGSIDAQRLIAMLEIHEEHLVLDEKGVHSVAHFLHARQLMYWQVYLHKTHICLKSMLKLFFQRLKFLIAQNIAVPLTPSLNYFLTQNYSPENLDEWLPHFILMDDYDIWTSLKNTQNFPDETLAFLAKSLLERNLFELEISFSPFETHYIQKISQKLGENSSFLLWQGNICFYAYQKGEKSIRIAQKNGQIISLEHSHQSPAVDSLSQEVEKYYLCYPKMPLLKSI